jgi:hypothetical protein
VIYFIRAANGAIKIGYSVNPVARLATMQTGSPVHLELVAVVTGTQRDEKALHAQFAEHRISGEWFEPAPALIAMVNSLPLYAPPPRRRHKRPRAQRATSGLSWRIEFCRRKTKQGDLVHWVYRFGSGANRRAVYGGVAEPWMLPVVE